MHHQLLTVPLLPQNRWRMVHNEHGIQVSARTSERRDELITITARYTDKHPDVACATQGKKPLTAEQWQDLLLGSKFTLSPGGHNAETFRTWEALEAG